MHRHVKPEIIFLALILASFGLRAETATVRGYWREPSGSVLRIARCEDGLCIQIVALSPRAHAGVDVHNPDPRLRGRRLCGLRIGAGFVEQDSQHAGGGHIYDPRTGRTYHGSMTAQGDRLKLRGFVGISLFGRTETWTRAGPVVSPCERQL